MSEKLIFKLFSFIWEKRLTEYKLIRVKGWRTCLVDLKWGGQRMSITFLYTPMLQPVFIEV